jgi:hypothetical protein
MARLRFLSGHRGRHRQRIDRHWAKLDLLGLHRRKREAIRGLQASVEILRHLVDMLDQLAGETFPGDEPDDLRPASTMMQAAVNGIMEAATDIAGHLGEIRFMATLDEITLEELGDDPEDGEANTEDDHGPDTDRTR